MSRLARSGPAAGGLVEVAIVRERDARDVGLVVTALGVTVDGVFTLCISSSVIV